MIEDTISLESFLSSLKLSEYLLHFALNGYSSVDECYELDEARLHEIGITKPGHVKRIISSIEKCKRQTSPWPQEDLDNFSDGKDPEEEFSNGNSVLEDRENTNVDDEVGTVASAEGDEGASNEARHSEAGGAEQAVDDADAPPLPPKKEKRLSASRPAPAVPPAPLRRMSDTPVPSCDSQVVNSDADAQTDTIKPRRKAPGPPSQLPSRSGSVTAPPVLPPRVDLGESPGAGHTTAAAPEQGDVEETPPCQSNSLCDHRTSSLIAVDQQESRSRSLMEDIEHALGRPLTPPPGGRQSVSSSPSGKAVALADRERPSTVPRTAPKKPSRPVPAVRRSRSSSKDDKESNTRITSAADTKDHPSSDKASLKSSTGSLDSIPGVFASGDDDLSGDESDHSLGDLVEDAGNDSQQQPDTQVISMSKHGDLLAAQLRGSGSDTSNQATWRKSTYGTAGRAAFLDKRGGQKNNRPFQKRFVVFDGNDLRYYKPNDKDTRSESLQIVPVSRMEDVEIVTGGKRPQLNLKTPNRTFIFSADDFNEITMWAMILMEAIELHKIVKQHNPNSDEIGGSMSNPDKEGWLKKQGNNVVMDWKDRYIVVKGSQLCYYYTFEDFVQEMPINCIDMALAKAKVVDAARMRINVVTAKRTFSFEADSVASCVVWKDALDTATQYGLGDVEVLEKLRENPANLVCADCGKTNPVWASVNLMVIVCAQCIGFHRRLGAQISRARSVLMDIRIWTPSLIKLMLEIGNVKANELWENKMPPDDKIRPDTTSEAREEFISAKYKDKRYFQWSPYYGQDDELGVHLRRSVVTDNAIGSLRLLVSGADALYVEDEQADPRTPYQLAEDAGKNLQKELLSQYNGHLSAEEREVLNQTSTPDEARTQSFDFVSGPVPEVVWERQGMLSRRSNKNELWKKKMFFLKDRSLYFDKGSKELELIDLRKVSGLQFEPFDGTITILFTNKSHFLKAETIDESEEWHTALRNKQVIGVPIQVQDANSSKVVYLVARCIDYIDSYGLETEGVYRLSGSLATIKQLLVLFNQDARSVQLTTDQYPSVHDVTGVLKKFLRELPEPLLTWHLYKQLVDNCCEKDHYTKIYRLKDLINELPDVNRCTLKAITMHLDKIIKNDQVTKMSLDNIVLIFGPSLMSKFQSTDQSVLQHEYEVVSDILSYYQWLFDLDETDLSRDMKIEEAKRKIEEAKRDMVKQTESTTISDLQFSVYIGNADDNCSVKLTSESNASKVCWYIINLRQLQLEKNWALFEVIPDIELERPVPGNELVLPLVMSWGRENRLVLKENYVAELTAPFQNSNLSLSGTLHVKKNDSSWKKHQFVEIKNGNLKIHGKKGASSESDNLPIHDMLLYVGIDKRKKSPCRHGFTLKTKSDVRFMCADDEQTMYKWIAAILKIKYPTGIWTSLQAEARTGKAQVGEGNLVETSSHWGRQSMIRRAPGASISILRDIMGRRQSLRKVK